MSPAPSASASAPSPEPVPEDLAADFLSRQADGEGPDLEDWSHRFADVAERAEFRQLVEDAHQAERILPIQARPGVLLGGRYLLMRELGAGGTGRVFQAQDLAVGRPVAIKLLADFSRAAFGPQAPWLREAAALAALGRSDIAAVHGVCTDGELRFVVQDLVEGRSLAELLAIWSADGPQPARERASWRRRAEIVRDVATSVEAAHAHGVLHGNLKPENILLRDDGSPVVLDFGLRAALDEGDSPLTRGLFGNVASMPPELTRPGARGHDARQDVYQLGLVLHELLTLQRPFVERSVSTLLERISLGDLARPRTIDPRIPPALEALCLKALEVNPERRHATMTAFREELQRCLRERDGSAAARWHRLTGWLGRAGRRLRGRSTGPG